MMGRLLNAGCLALVKDGQIPRRFICRTCVLLWSGFFIIVSPVFYRSYPNTTFEESKLLSFDKNYFWVDYRRALSLKTSLTFGRIILRGLA
jgi:hypothetical protein